MDDMLIGGAWTEGPSAIGEESFIFSNHGSLPSRVRGSLAVAGGFRF
jgi:hypothetical protein